MAEPIGYVIVNDDGTPFKTGGRSRQTAKLYGTLAHAKAALTISSSYRRRKVGRVVVPVYAGDPATLP